MHARPPDTLAPRLRIRLALARWQGNRQQSHRPEPSGWQQRRRRGRQRGLPLAFAACWVSAEAHTPPRNRFARLLRARFVAACACPVHRTRLLMLHTWVCGRPREVVTVARGVEQRAVR